MKHLFLLLLVFCAFGRLAHAQGGRAKYERGETVKGKPVGVWEYYENDSLALVINYDSNRVRYVRPDTARCKVWLDSAWQVRRLSRAPRLLGSRDAVIISLLKKLRYPRADQAAQRIGNVVVSCIVFEDGQVSKPFVELTNGSTLAAELLQQVEELPLRYLPGIYRGKPVRTKIQFWATFCIEAAHYGPLTSGKAPGCPQTIPVVYGGFNQLVITALGAPRTSYSK